MYYYLFLPVIPRVDERILWVGNLLSLRILKWNGTGNENLESSFLLKSIEKHPRIVRVKCFKSSVKDYYEILWINWVSNVHKTYKKKSLSSNGFLLQHIHVVRYYMFYSFKPQDVFNRIYTLSRELIHQKRLK